MLSKQTSSLSLSHKECIGRQGLFEKKARKASNVARYQCDQRPLTILSNIHIDLKKMANVIFECDLHNTHVTNVNCGLFNTYHSMKHAYCRILLVLPLSVATNKRHITLDLWRLI